MTEAKPNDAWASGSAYDAFMGRWSRLVAPAFLAWLDRPPGSRWIDVGCGTGALTAAILAANDPETVLGVDPSAAFLEVARQRVDDPRVRFLEGSGGGIPAASGAADTTVAGLALNFAPDPAAMVTDMRRVTAPDSIVALYVWDYAEGMQMLRRFWAAATALDPAAQALDQTSGAVDERSRFAICAPDPLRRIATAAGLEDIEVRGIEIPTVFADFDDFWGPFLGGSGPAPAYVASLDPERRAALAADLRASLPTATDGSIPLTARAWALRGTA
jgi:SAM-dependent methyltransferase